MARMKGSKTTAQARVTKKTSRSQDVPDIYQEMLADASASSPVQENQEGRAIKRRRIAGRIVLQAPDDSTPYQSDHSTKTARESEFDELFEDVKPMPQQVVQSDSEDSEDSDLDWEEVNLKDNANHESTTELQNARSEKFNLVLHEDKGSNGGDLARRSVKRKPITIEERKLRISIHKLHVCCLLVHGFLRNHWCNDAKVHVRLSYGMRKPQVLRYLVYSSKDSHESHHIVLESRHGKVTIPKVPLLHGRFRASLRCLSCSFQDFISRTEQAQMGKQPGDAGFSMPSPC